MHGRAKEILALAADVESAHVIEFHSGDREPGASLTAQGRRWIIDALQLLARAGTKD